MTAAELLRRYGTTYAEQAGIRLRNKPSPLYQLLVLAMLLSARIRADIAVDAARELFVAGWRTPHKMVDSTWQQRVDALGRGGYARYDESTATRLREGAQLLLDEWRGDLRQLPEEPEELRRSIRRFPGIGALGADIFCREVQTVWPHLRPYFDEKTMNAAGRHGLPTDPERLAEQVEPDQFAALAAALIRAG